LCEPAKSLQCFGNWDLQARIPGTISRFNTQSLQPVSLKRKKTLGKSKKLGLMLHLRPASAFRFRINKSNVHSGGASGCFSGYAATEIEVATPF